MLIIMVSGQILSSYEPSMAIEGTVKGEKPENTLIIRQVEFIRRLGNLVIYNKYRKIFVNAVIWLDKLLILKGRDKMYIKVKKKLNRTYNIGKEFDDLTLKKQVLYCIDLFSEQLNYVNRSMEKDVWGELDLDMDKVKLLEQQKLDDDN